jgi:TRAP-type C4-dicarboxylate transport system permease small subunit
MDVIKWNETIDFPITSILGKGAIMKALIIKAMTAFDAMYYVLVQFSKLLLGAIVLVVTAQVFCRKFFGWSIKWSEEMALVWIVWLTYIAMAIGVEKKLHIAIALFFDKFPVPIKTLIEKITNILIFVFGIFMIKDGISLIQSTTTSILPATGFKTSIRYITIPIGGLYLCYFGLIFFFGLEKYRKIRWSEWDE